MRTSFSLRSAALLLAALMRVLIGFPAQAQTTEPTDTPIFRTIHMTSPTTGWALVTVPDHDPDAGMNYTPGQIYPGTLAYLLHTQDSGQSWTNVTPSLELNLPQAGDYGCDCSDNGITGFFILDDNHAWLMIDDAGVPNQIFNGINVRGTSDGGQTWQKSATGIDAPYTIAASFIDPLHGWLLVGDFPLLGDGTEPAALFQTVDGGLNWTLAADDGVNPHPADTLNPMQPISAPATSITTMIHLGMAFESVSDGWLLTTDYDPGLSDLRHTSDDGVTWQVVHLMAAMPPRNSLEDCIAAELHVWSPESASFIGSCHEAGQKLLFHTDDDGAVWQITPLPKFVFDVIPPHRLFMLNASSAWSIGCEAPANALDCNDLSLPAVLFKTSDGGISWDKIGKLPDAFKMISTEISDIGPQMDFVDDRTGWAITPAGELFTTSDGGKSWTALNPSISAL